MRYLGLLVVFAVVWVLLSGMMKPLLLGLGFASCLLCVWLAGRMHRVEGEAGPALRLPRVPTYLAWLLKEVVVANLQVIRVVLSPRIELDPVLLRVRATQHSSLARVIYGTSITLTPGTLTLDVDDDEVLVHALDRAGAESLRGGAMDGRVTALEADL